jgi:threonine synthase
MRKSFANSVLGLVMNEIGLEHMKSFGVIERYREHLPITEKTPIISLQEGSTPLIYASRLSALVGRGCHVYLKYEGLNPTGSFKDRGMTVAMSKAVEAGAKLVICASTGNTSASAAAYAAKAGIQCAVLLPAGKISMGKLSQAFIYGAVVIALEGNFDQCLTLVRELASEPGIAIVNSINPYRLEGQKTAAFEVVDRLGEAPAIHLLPIGNAGNVTAYWRGYREYQELGKSSRAPRMVGIQAAGAAPIYWNRIIEKPETAASAIRIGNPASWRFATAAFDESGGGVDIVTDTELFEAQKWLASKEGVFVEPASAAGVAGLFKAVRQEVSAESPLRRIPDESVIVCTLTGHGLKDVSSFMDGSLRPITALPEKGAILSLLEKVR